MFGPEWGEPSSHKPVTRPALLLFLPLLPANQLPPHALALPAPWAQTHQRDSCPCTDTALRCTLNTPHVQGTRAARDPTGTTQGLKHRTSLAVGAQ